MASPQKVVLLACGSFNPPTNMHLRMFEIARDTLHKTGRYNVIAGIMSPVSDNYKKKDLAPAKHRCAMVKHALKSSKWIRMDSWESEQPTWLETERVLSHFRVELNNQANCTVRSTPSKKRKKDLKNEDEIDRGIEKGSSKQCNKEDYDSVQLKLLCGGDLLESFAVPGLWKDEDIEEIVGRYGLVVITRAASNPLQFIYESDVLTKNQNNIHIVTEWIYQDVSSTKIRRALRRGESVKYLLQDTVIDYIKEHQMYGITCDKNEPCHKKTYFALFSAQIVYPAEEISKLKDLMSPTIDHNQLMDFVDGYCDPDLGPTQTLDVNTLSPPIITNYRRSQSPMHSGDSNNNNHGTRSQRRASATNSPKRMMVEEESGGKSPQHVPCITDIGTIVRRVRNSVTQRTLAKQDAELILKIPLFLEDSSEEKDSTIERHALRQTCKQKAAAEPCERPNKLITRAIENLEDLINLNVR